MKTLILKHNGHEAHVPYELPDSVRFDCFVPEHGLCVAYVDPRAEEILVLEVHRPKKSSRGTDGAELLPPELCSHPAVLEQAGDVCAVLERALKSHDTYASVGWTTPEDSADRAVLSTIAQIAHHEKEAEIAFYLLPGSIRCSIPMLSHSHNRMAEKALAAFITGVLVPRAQDFATSAAKRREAEWNEEQALVDLHVRLARGDDLAIDLAKERA